MVESDAKVVVDAINLNIDYEDYFGLRIGACKSYLSLLRDVSLKFIYRSANMCAHSLAQLALSSDRDSVWEGETPSVISDLLARDCAVLA